jgi:hypothetical protein
MNSYPLESDLVAELDRCDELMRLCASGQLSFENFCTEYDSFYWSFALDGHESDAVGLVVLTKYADRIAPHRALAETVLSSACSDLDADKESYRSAGRFGSIEAVARLKLLVAELLGSPERQEIAPTETRFVIAKA